VSDRIRLAISLGDPAGIGPEVVVRALPRIEAELGAACTVVGDAGLVAAAAERLGVAAPEDVHAPASVACALEELFAGRASAAGGRAAAACVREAIALIQAGEADALVTAPLNKEALGLAGEPYPGHTELLATELAAPASRMMLQGGTLRVVLVTTHVALAEVPRLVTREAILTTCRTADEGLRALGIAAPRLAVTALNPHAGDGGRFGREDLDVVAPAVAEARSLGLDVTGPHPADTLFAQVARPERSVDAVVALYHDQGLIPVKLASFGSATNVTLGLPLVRTSPDHGTAYDIAGQGAADPSSFVEAARVALELVRSRRSPGAQGRG
jgi:4-hydroxythreonine-4-phosphate dehydrogenase